MNDPNDPLDDVNRLRLARRELRYCLHCHCSFKPEDESRICWECGWRLVAKMAYEGESDE